MMRLKNVLKVILILLICTSLMTANSAIAKGVYSTGFKTASIGVSYPKESGLSFDGSLTVRGETDLSEVWLCVRGPGNETAVYPAKVERNNFVATLYLRFGKGIYTVWAGDNPNKFDGRIRFKVNNTATEDVRYLAPSAHVNSDHESVKSLAMDITEGKTTDMERIRAIHKWVITNIEYDYDAYLKGDNTMYTASETIDRGKGTCRDYSFTVAALARAIGIPTRVVYGNINNTTDWDTQLHAWNQAYINGEWITLDTTWDAGYIEEGKFVAAPSDKYFNPDIKSFAKTHTISSITTH